MVKVEFTYRPKSLHPTVAASAHHMRNEQGMLWEAIAAEVVNKSKSRLQLARMADTWCCFKMTQNPKVGWLKISIGKVAGLLHRRP